MDKKLLHLGLNLGPFTPNPHTLPSELSGTMKIFEGNDVYIQILNSDYLSTSPHFQKSDSVEWQNRLPGPIIFGIYIKRASLPLLYLVPSWVQV